MSTTTLNLTQKGMLLIAVPLIFELGFAAALNYQLKQAERNVQSEIRARETIACANTITRLQVDAGTTLIAYKATGSSVLRKRLDALIEQVPEEFERFKEQAAADPQIVVLVNSTTLSHCKTALTRLLSALKSIENTEVDPSAPGAVVQFNHQIFSVQPPIKELVAELNVLVDQVQKQQYASSARAKHSRQLALLMLSVGLLFNIAITVVLAVFYTRGITTRLSVLLENTKRFARSQELSAPLEDADEIGELDRVFHDMAKAAQQAEQLKGEFISIVSHDLQAPLTSIRGLLKILPERLHNAADERTMKLIETAHDETGRLISLTNDLLDLAKMESGRFSLKLQPTDLKTVISRSVQSVEMLLHNRKIEIAYAPEANQVFADGERLVQVMVNLLSNAIKFSPDGSKIKISVAERKNDMEVQVQDQGAGIAVDALTKIFDRFEQAAGLRRDQQHGAGLGLAICKMIVEAHRGTIGVDSIIGQGSKFWFRIPRSNEVTD